MLTRIKQLWKAEDGLLSMHDYIITIAILVMGSIIGLTTLRNSIVQEFGDIALGLENLDQTYSVSITFAGGSTKTMLFVDGPPLIDPVGLPPGDINLSVAPDDE